MHSQLHHESILDIHHAFESDKEVLLFDFCGERVLCTLQRRLRVMLDITHHSKVVLVLECGDTSLAESRAVTKAVPEIVVRGYLTQLLQGFAYLHSLRYFHGSVALENILLVGDRAKLADFSKAERFQEGGSQVLDLCSRNTVQSFRQTAFWSLYRDVIFLSGSFSARRSDRACEMCTTVAHW